MKRIALFGICLALAATTAGAGQRMHYGVPWDAVDWEKLCKNVKPLKYTNQTTGQTCPKIHPTHPAWRKRNHDKKWRCTALANDYEWQVKSIGGCKQAFGAALQARSIFPGEFEEPLPVWRKRYFKLWMRD